MHPSFVKIHQGWLRWKSGLWFLPSIIVLGCMALGLLLVEADARWGSYFMRHWPRLFQASPEGARALLSAVAGSMITVAGTVFSITIVALALTSSLFSSRALRNFMSDRVNQASFGIFLGIFAYCLVVVRTIHEERHAAPALAVFAGILLALLSIGVLIYYIHHISTSIQVAYLLPTITNETISSIDDLFPEGAGKEGFEDERECAEPGRIWFAIPADRTGYIQEVATEDLLEFATQHGTVARMEYSVGEFIVEGRPLVSVLVESPPGDEEVAHIQSLYAVGRNRTIEQDVSFGVRQIVDIALKGLSPAINDPNTAVMCIHHLTAIMLRLTQRHIESRYRSDDDGNLRLIVKRVDFESLMREAFGEIREYAAGKVSVLSAMMVAFTTIARATRNPHRQGVLRAHSQALAEVWRESVHCDMDRAYLEKNEGIMLRAIEDMGQKL